MAYEELCMYCFKDREGDAVCPHCGRDSRAAVPQIQMLPGSLVHEGRFLVGRALGQDADGIVYTALDTRKGNTIKLREYFPRESADRLNDGSVVPQPGKEDAFERGMRRLEDSVQTGGDRHFYFEENGTAYVAQRKRPAAPPTDEDYTEEEERGRGIGKIVAIAGGIVALAVVGLVLLLNGAFGRNDVTSNPTLEPGATVSPAASATSNVWAPAATPSPTPYVSPTFAALVDPGQSWMDYTYSGDVEAEYNSQMEQSTQVTAIPTIRPNTTSSGTVGEKSGKSDIIRLQQRLVQLGWLNANLVTGRYDDATKQAVRDFQTYINNTVRPVQKLTVDGIAGPKTLQWLYGTDAARPTPTPTPLVTANPRDSLTVDRNSSKTDIRAVQRKLITLGLMSAGSDDGVYGNTTTQAVRSFQQRVNQLQGNGVLPVTGVVDASTMAYLNYYIEWWESMQTATATPIPTATVTVPPTPAPTQEPETPEDKMTVNKYSQPESIRYLQEMLIEVGLLPAGASDGVYGDATVEAVTRLQQWVNSAYGRNVLPITGIADAQTLQYLEYAVDNGMSYPVQKPTATATAQPTAQPTATSATAAPVTQAPTEVPDMEEDKMYVGPDSQKESIEYVQQQLIAVGLLQYGSDDGVYGNGTKSAVQAFQAWVNRIYGRTELEETGIADSKTLQYLEEAVDRGMTVQPTQGPTQAPTQVPTEAPTQIPTEVPTQVPTEAPTQAPTPEPTRVPVIPVRLALSMSGASESNGGYLIEEDTAVIRWAADGEVSSYSVQIKDSDGHTYYQEENTTDTSLVIERAAIKANTAYTLTVWAVPVNGTKDDAAHATLMFGALPAATPAPTATPEPTAVPTQAPGRIESLVLAFDGNKSNGTYTMNGSSLTVSWAATGSVESFTVTLTDNSGNTRTLLENSRQTSGTLRKSDLREGETYTVTVVATPTGGGTVAWVDGKFAVPASGAPTPAPAEEIAAPSVNVQGDVTRMDGYYELRGNSATFTWTSGGNVQGYVIRVMMVTGDGNEEMFSQKTTSTSFTASLGILDPGYYIFYVSAVPNGAANDESQWKTGLVRFFYNAVDGE